MKTHPAVLVFVTQYMQTGGIESHLREFCLHLAKAGVHIDLVIPNSHMLPEAETFFRQICKNVYFGRDPNSILRFMNLFLVGLRLSISRYDSIYTNGQGESIFLFSKLLFHNGLWVHHHHTSGDIKDQVTWGANYLRALKSASTVIACANRNAHEMSKVLNRDVQSIPCFSREINVLTNKGSYGKIRFGYYGRLIPEKGVDILCQLCNDPDLSSMEFHIWGEGKNYTSTFFKKFPNLHFHGSFNRQEELVEVISSIDALLLLSTHPEGLPISLLEAMSAGLPWLATDKGGIPDIALDAHSTRVIPSTSNYSEIKDAILSLALDIENGKIDRRVQKELYQEKFSSSALTTKWLETLGLKNALTSQLSKKQLNK